MSPKNMAASVHARLTEIARRTGRPLHRVVLQQLLERTARSPRWSGFYIACRSRRTPRASS